MGPLRVPAVSGDRARATLGGLRAARGRQRGGGGAARGRAQGGGGGAARLFLGGYRLPSGGGAAQVYRLLQSTETPPKKTTLRGSGAVTPRRAQHGPTVGRSPTRAPPWPMMRPTLRAITSTPAPRAGVCLRIVLRFAAHHATAATSTTSAPRPHASAPSFRRRAQHGPTVGHALSRAPPWPMLRPTPPLGQPPHACGVRWCAAALRPPACRPACRSAAARVPPATRPA